MGLIYGIDFWKGKIPVLLQDEYHISLIIRQSFFLEKQSQKSRSILKDGSRSFRLF